MTTPSPRARRSRCRAAAPSGSWCRAVTVPPRGPGPSPIRTGARNTTYAHSANSYRPDGVGLEQCGDTGCGDDIGWTGTGQWFRYTVNVATARTYTVSLRLASPSGVTDALHIASSSGASLSGAVSAPDTGGWQTYATETVSVALPAGRQTLTICQDNGGWNIHDLTLS